ncbi:glycosyltransferase family 4 protein [Daejeonella lutea]|uniref:Glycosyltransferase involved in cell wall bisynthesis n=1 Tax=Daejeonella lutea TaxID=572036 RepID=A0A1T5FAC5_9SPHI|nr:glycosyltransferase family 1 protein [Daejeonella lutea]SKB93100.1 Glycosyltransferase involved in cell wall bisynthesis [Daejeonella lutea]
MPEKIIVGVDIRDLRIAKTGGKTYLEEISKQFKTKNYDCKFIFFDTTIPVYTGKYKFFKLIEHIRFFTWKQVILPIKAWINKCDILFCSDYFSPYFSPGFKTVVVFYDSFFYEYPSHYNSQWLRIFKTLGVGAARRAEKVITITEYTKKRIAHFTGINPEKIIAIHLAPKGMAIAEPDPSYTPSLHIPSSKFILHVGTLEKRKNLVRLIEALKLLHNEGYTDYSLVLVGQPSPKNDMDGSAEINEAIIKHGLQDSVLLSGYASDNDLGYFYKNAEMYAFPSINEGFGLPLLEAFHHKIPVIVADNTCLPEVGGEAILCFDPFDTKDIANKMKMIINNPALHEDLVRRGIERLESFSWSSNADQLVKIFKGIVNKN